MFIYNLYKPLNVHWGVMTTKPFVTGQSAGYEALSVFFLPSFLRNFFDRQYSFTWHQLRRVAVNALVYDNTVYF